MYIEYRQTFLSFKLDEDIIHAQKNSVITNCLGLLNLFVISRICNNRDNNRLKNKQNQINILQLSVCYNQKFASTKFFYNRVSLYVIEIDLLTWKGTPFQRMSNGSSAAKALTSFPESLKLFWKNPSRLSTSMTEKFSHRELLRLKKQNNFTKKWRILLFFFCCNY